MKSHILPITLLVLFSTNAQASYVKGHIDTVGTDYENFSIRGWACQTGENVSINTHIYLNGPAGTGSIYRSLMASNNSEQAVANACSNSHRKNRFSLTVPLADVYKHRGKSIYIHGISSKGTGNKLLSKSGNYKFPDVPTSKVRGYIDSLSKSGSDYYVRGWACQKYYKKPIDVHLYVGGRAGSGGKYVTSSKANLASGSSIASACGTNATAYKFDVKVPQSIVQQNPNASIYVHGISLIKTGNLSIDNSGTFRLPGPITANFTYDARGRLVNVKDHASKTVTYSYDDAGNRTKVNN
jgi:YD repeat-containing protein